MKDEDSIFGTKPDRLNRLVFEAMEDSESDEQGTPTASLNALVEQLGSQIDRYKLLRVLGEGGMGMVYLAEQEGSIRRKVALKVIKPGMDSARVIARFENERQALALLDHPNIAQVYDAGTTKSGRPYFVMEHVKGSPITDYCDRHKLSIEDRLRLFQQVCLAVHHAHQKGIIHRDLKPSNVLVSAENDRSMPKIIDFGVAKAMSQPLTERTLFTEDSQLLGTPEYMSPEQAEMANEDIDTRSDIYSLGVLLYVLLAGILPYDSKTFRQGGVEHIRKIIRETDPKTPSTRLTKLGEDATKLAESRRTELAALTKCLHRELEWIPLKAMRKDRAERYRSASELADDIENYLTGAPLMAGPLGTGYRLRKFVRRNRMLVSGIAAVLVVLALGVVASTVFALGQARARADAERAGAEAQAISLFLRRDVLGSARNIKGREATVIDALNAAVARLDQGMFHGQPLIEQSTRWALTHLYYDLGHYALAAQHQKIVNQIGKEQLGGTGVDLNWLAVCYYHAGMYREAEPLYRQVIEKASRNRTEASVKRWLSTWNANLGTTLARLGQYEEAERLVRPLVEAEPSAEYGLHLGEIYREQGKYNDAERTLLDSLDAGRKSTDERVQHYGAMVRCMHELALLRLAQGDYEKAEELFEQGMDLGARDLPGKDHPYMLRHVNGLAIIRINQQRYEEAESLLERALAGQELKLGHDHPDTLKTIHNFGVLHREQGQLGEAEKHLTEALESRRVKLGSDHPHALESMHELAVLYVAKEDYEKAAPLMLDAFHGREAKLGPKHPCTIDSLKQLVHFYESWNKPEEAQKWRAKLPSKEDTRE